jgi:hypothetical protein
MRGKEEPNSGYNAVNEVKTHETANRIAEEPTREDRPEDKAKEKSFEDRVFEQYEIEEEERKKEEAAEAAAALTAMLAPQTAQTHVGTDSKGVNTMDLFGNKSQ